MDYYYRTRPEQSSEAGFSLVGIMVLIGVCLIAIVTTMNINSNSRFTASLLDSKGQYSQVEQALVKIIETELHNEIQSRAGCIDPAQFLNSQAGIAIDGDFVFGGISADLNAALARCQNPRYPANPNAPGQNTLRFCLKIDQNTTKISEQVDALVEVRAEIVDLFSMNPISCNDYDAMRVAPDTASGGILLGLDIYWQADVNNRQIINSKGVNTIVFKH